MGPPLHVNPSQPEYLEEVHESKRKDRYGRVRQFLPDRMIGGTCADICPDCFRFDGSMAHAEVISRACASAHLTVVMAVKICWWVEKYHWHDN
jgi:hypothetical protein